ncbi:MAG: ABC transporter permease, partial [Candidatus Hodarchaeales archaeon]
MENTLGNEFEGKAISEFRLAIRQLKRDKMALVGLIIIIGMIFLAIFSPFIVPYDPAVQNLKNILDPPSASHLFGTDSFGRDVFSRVLNGARVSVIVGIVSCGIAILIGVPLGILAGFGGSKVDNLISRIIDGIMAFPPLLLAIVLMAVLGPSMINVMIALGFTISTHFARLTRGETLKVKEES